MNDFNDNYCRTYSHTVAQDLVLCYSCDGENCAINSIRAGEVITSNQATFDKLANALGLPLWQDFVELGESLCLSKL